jgi:methylated-DNA-[protein]-cysteine S-methyltransferase
MKTNFYERVYAKLKEVPKGYVTTYKELSKALNTKAYRAVGNAMRHNPYAPVVPCHRVVRSDGTIGGFNGKTKGKEIDNKIKLLKNEGVIVKDNKIVDFNKILYKFRHG